ncbi:hypothetical protein ACKUT9_11055 [Mycobacterium seoulense]|uniref:hypothetical protein n=1 Tax=Mycobacterium seoulense TaxID=386911 RepID=UPI003CF24562
MGAEARKPKPWSQLFLGLVGVLILAAVVVGSLKGLNEVVAVVLAFIGGAIVTMAAFWSRIHGDIEVNRDGFKISIARAEGQVEQSKPIPGIEPRPLGGSIIGGGVPIPGQTAMPTQEPAREVRVVPDVLSGLMMLAEGEMAQVVMALFNMRTPDFHVEADPVTTAEGRPYRVHTVPDTDIKVWYRPLSDDDPDTLVVILIEKPTDMPG